MALYCVKSKLLWYCFLKYYFSTIFYARNLSLLDEICPKLSPNNPETDMFKAGTHIAASWWILDEQASFTPCPHLAVQSKQPSWSHAYYFLNSYIQIYTWRLLSFTLVKQVLCFFYFLLFFYSPSPVEGSESPASHTSITHVKCIL